MTNNIRIYKKKMKLLIDHEIKKKTKKKAK